MSFQTRKAFVHLQNTRYFWWSLRAFWHSIDSNGTTTFKTQKGSKGIVTIVHATSVIKLFYVRMRLLRQQQHTYASWYTCECTEETDTEKKNCWIKPLFLFTFVHKKILLSHWWHTMSVLPFWALNVVVALLSMEGQKALGFHQKYLHLCSKGKRKSYRFGN